MLLSRIEISDYRSIDHAEIENIDNFITLIGANNQGKTNVLKAIRLSLSCLENLKYYQYSSRRSGILGYRRRNDEIYDWSHDYPVLKRYSKKDGATKIRLDFILSDNERDDFYKKFNIKINENIPVVLKFYKDQFDLDIPKPGKGKKGIQDKVHDISKWISSRVNFVYVPAIRTAEDVQQIMAELIGNAIFQAEQAILDRVEDELEIARRDAISRVETELTETLKKFVSSVKSISVQDISSNRRAPSRNQYLVEVDDGCTTPIYQKGDGVQSLATLALMRSQGQIGAHDKVTIVAIEEPEAHLHSDAIHQIRAVLSESLPNTQIFLTTHSPIFVQRKSIRSNILVRSSKAQPAKTLEEIRKVLGVRAPDNLNAAACVVFLEGKTDCDFIQAYILDSDDFLASKLDSGELRLVDIGGAANVEYNCRLYSNLSCEIFALFDNDDAGRNALAGVVDRELLSSENAFMYVHSCRSQVHLEDLAKMDHPKEAVCDVGLTPDEEFESAKTCFSLRIKALQKRSGRTIAEKNVLQLKLDLADKMCQDRNIEDADAKLQVDKLLGRVKAFFLK